MNFEKINMYGFKSFADRIEIKFESGITAIVGPNGCGKSNVADAIGFVMGESSAKKMRGSSMQDVIFNGTEKRNPQSYCEVSLYFDNTNKIFSLDYNEVVLTRKLYKSGESEYLINKTICRRKDIVNAFRELGLGKESYCVIGQGKIDSILSAKPEDRRNIFEEAAGISKFKEEKNSNLTKLANVSNNLVILNNTISELERQLGPLKNQAENARIFLELSQRLKELEINIYVYNYDNSSIEKQKIKDAILRLNGELSVKQRELETAVNDYDVSQNKIAELDETINDLRNELLRLSVDLEKQNGELKLYNEKVANLQEQNKKYLAQVEIDQKTQTENDAQSQKLRLEKDEIEERLKKNEIELKNIDTDYKLTIDKLSIGENLAESVDAEFYSAIEKQGDIKSTLLKYQTELESLRQRQDEISSEKDKLSNDSRNFEYKISSAEEEIEKLEEKIEQKNGERQNIINDMNKLSDILADANDIVEQKKADFHTKQARYNVLNEMKEYNEGYNLAVKRLLEQAQDGSSIGKKVVGVVANLMKVPQKYETAIEQALASSLQNIVTKNEEDAKALIEYLKVNRFGRVTFLPLTSVKNRYVPQSVEAKLSMRGVQGVASRLISYDSQFANIFGSLLGATVIVDNMDNAIAFSRATSYQSRVVTLDGDIISTMGSMTGGSRKQETTNILGRDREIEDLKKSLSIIKNDIDKFELKISDIKAKSAKKSADLSKLIDEIHSLEMEKSKQEDIVSSYQEQIDDIDEKLSEYEITFTTLLDKVEFIEKQLELVTEQQKDVDTKKSRASESKKQANTDFGKLRARRDELLQKMSDIKIKMETDKKDLSNISSSEDRIMVSSAECEYREKEMMLNVQKNNQEIEELQIKIDEIMANTAFSSSTKQVDEVREQINELTEEKKLAQQKMNEADASKMMLSGDIQKANDKKAKEENQIVKIDTDLENMQNRIWEEYQMTYGDAKQEASADFDYNSGSAECSNIKKKIQKLGNVNIDAIEDVKSISERYNDLAGQRDDLVKAQSDLNIIIDNLTETMQNKFNNCFSNIRSNFQTIFRELFGGGRADIKLEDEKNALECGIDIIAEPPGKKLQSITLLSGGEKALTAVAILFSILKLRPMPFCVLDEIEAALDDANVERYAKYLHRYSGETQFIVITHRKPTMELADALYGVTMEEKGVSKVVSVKLSDAIKLDNGK